MVFVVQDIIVRKGKKKKEWDCIPNNQVIFVFPLTQFYPTILSHPKSRYQKF